jgi:hypothetical protein
VDGLNLDFHNVLLVFRLVRCRADAHVDEPCGKLL